MSWKGSARWIARHRTAVVIVLLVCAHIAIAQSVIYAKRSFMRPLFFDAMYQHGRGCDFYAIYHAGVCLNQGESPYRRGDDGVTPYYYPFRYLPPAAYLGKLFTLLDPYVAYEVWALVLEALLAWLIWTLRRVARSPGWWLASTAILLLSTPFFLELHMGQFTFAAMALTAIAVTRGSRFGAAMFSAAVLLKAFPLAAIPAFVRNRRYWIYGMLAIACVVLFAGGYFLFSPRRVPEWRRFYAMNFGSPTAITTGNVSLAYLVVRAMMDAGRAVADAQRANVLWWLRTVVLGLSAVLVVMAKNRSIPAGVSLLLLGHFVTYPDMWEHHVSGVIVLGVLLLLSGTTRGWATGIVLGSLIVLALPTPFVFFDVRRNPAFVDPAMRDPALLWPTYATYAVIVPKAVPTLLLFLTAAWSLLRVPAPAAAEETMAA